MIKRKKGFTLIELIIVMAIFASIVGLGIVSFNNANKSSTVSEATGDLVGIIKETQNLAKNNSLPNSISSTQKAQSIYYYVLTIEGSTVAPYGKVTRYIFGKGEDNWNTDFIIEGDKKSKIFNNINYEFGTTNVCRSLIFENLTGEIRAYAQTIKDVNTMQMGFADNTLTKCEYTVKMINDANYNKTVVVDVVKGTYGIKGE